MTDGSCMDRGGVDDVERGRLPWEMLRTPTRHPVTVHVAAHPETVLEHLRTALDDGRAVRLGVLPSSEDVAGSVDGTRVVLRSARSPYRGFGARRLPIADAEPSGSGTVLRGHVMVPPFWERWLVMWRALNVFFVIVVVLGLVVTLVADRAQLPGLLIGAAAWLAVAALQGLFVVLAFRTADRETERMLRWLDRQGRTLERKR